MESSRVARGASDRDEQEQAGSGSSRHAYQHEQSGVDVQQPRAMGRGRVATGASDGESQELGNLAFTWKSQGFANRAISLIEDCCKRQAVVLGSEHSDTVSSRELLTLWQLEIVELSE